MRVIVVGTGNQGRKRVKVAGRDLVSTVDPVNPEANFRSVELAPLDSYDAALVCTPDGAKPTILSYLLENGKHVLVEKPLLGGAEVSLRKLKELAERNRVVCYTAYNHRFEPHILRLKRTLDANWLGKVYQAKFYYGNGTARDVRDSAWRDTGLGVLADLGSHLLDWTLMLFGRPSAPPRVWAAHRFENRAFDHFQFTFPSEPVLEFEMSMISWRNTFRFDLFAENGSVHIDCLCKWGVSTYTERRRVLPSGAPRETVEQLPKGDPTWELEYAHFKNLCQKPANNIDNDIWIDGMLAELGKQSPP
jgi:scyllo-inositol 2-dehydrogenase (NADP+)